MLVRQGGGVVSEGGTNTWQESQPGNIGSVVPFVMSEMAGHSKGHFLSAETQNIVCQF